MRRFAVSAKSATLEFLLDLIGFAFLYGALWFRILAFAMPAGFAILSLFRGDFGVMSVLIALIVGACTYGSARLITWLARGILNRRLLSLILTSVVCLCFTLGFAGIAVLDASRPI